MDHSNRHVLGFCSTSVTVVLLGVDSRMWSSDPEWIPQSVFWCVPVLLAAFGVAEVVDVAYAVCRVWELVRAHTDNTHFHQHLLSTPTLPTNTKRHSFNMWPSNWNWALIEASLWISWTHCWTGRRVCASPSDPVNVFLEFYFSSFLLFFGRILWTNFYFPYCHTVPVSLLPHHQLTVLSTDITVQYLWFVVWTVHVNAGNWQPGRPTRHHTNSVVHY